ncbi:outer membrane transport energization protein TonB [Methylophilus rhizosphaerae]|uniref:Protein TonB n=1 Tax=Methylophilus rhizosphaerae TaxID=492660 RepID=A0A1G8Z7A0_9PROT|nr:energy transducer TonB [Methylophilus rhizosphaerae]SDK10961.1 outer membrane transport energization protein TonB [Methylophilus rhizosphaerae]
MSTTALKTPAQHSTIWDSLTDKSKARKLVATSEDFDKLSERVVSKLHHVEQIIPRNKLLVLIAVVVLAHILGLTGFINALKQPGIVKPKKTEVIVEFVKPEIEPPPVIEPPKPLPPPPPKVQHAEPPPKVAPKPAALKTAPAEQNIAPNDMVVQENTTAAKTTGPVVADPAPEPAPPAPPVVKEEPLVEAKGGVGHLNNPPPEYPEFAADQGSEGTVILRVKVLPNGKPAEVKVKKSSGFSLLDDAAVAAAKKWAFTPAKRGNTPVEGWAVFPVEFRLQ